MILLGLTIHNVYLLTIWHLYNIINLCNFYVTPFHTYSHTQTHTHIHSLTHTHTLTDTHTHTITYTFSHTHSHTHTHIHTHTITRTFPYTHSHTLSNTLTKRALKLVMAKGEASIALQICIKMLILDTYKRLLTQAHSHTSCPSIATLSLKWREWGVL